MVKKLSFMTCVAGAVLAFAAPLKAQELPIELNGDVKLEKTIEENGAKRTELVAPEVIVPGDRLIFLTSYNNHGATPVEKFEVTNPLPGAVRLAPDADPALVVSVDNGKTYGKLADLKFVNADGSSRPAQAEDVTHVKWLLPSVAPGEKGSLQYPAIIR